MADSSPLSIGLCAQLACILEVSSFKVGNVSFDTAFANMTFRDFLFSAAAIAPVMEQAPLRPVGATILDAIRATRRVTAVNTNLGIVLLLTPLANVPVNADLRGGVTRTLLRLDVADARAAYEAIRLAQPGWMGEAAEQDVRSEPTVTLREAMALAAARDLIARQYVNDFEQVFDGFESLRTELGTSAPTGLGNAVTRLHLRLLAKYPDSLIARKHGPDAALEVMREARRVSAALAVNDPYALRWFHDWLLAGGRNPGTTADLVTACLFVALRTGMIQLPLPASHDLLDR